MPKNTRTKPRRKRIKKVVYNKLVCNLIPKRLDRLKLQYTTTQAKDDATFDKMLRRKNIEEAREVRNASTKEKLTAEIADQLHTLNTLARLHGIGPESLLKAHHKNIRHKGSLSNRTILEWVQDDGYNKRNR
jgi:predicted house-cleaning noncanonical NTP pyrophosphatase (MazG superfamily)